MSPIEIPTITTYLEPTTNVKLTQKNEQITNNEYQNSGKAIQKEENFNECHNFEPSIEKDSNVYNEYHIYYDIS